MKPKRKCDAVWRLFRVSDKISAAWEKNRVRIEPHMKEKDPNQVYVQVAEPLYAAPGALRDLFQRRD